MSKSEITYTVVVIHPNEASTVTFRCSSDELKFRTHGIAVPPEAWLVADYHGGVSFIPWSNIYFITCSDPDFDPGW